MQNAFKHTKNNKLKPDELFRKTQTKTTKTEKKERRRKKYQLNSKTQSLE